MIISVSIPKLEQSYFYLDGVALFFSRVFGGLWRSFRSISGSATGEPRSLTWALSRAAAVGTRQQGIDVVELRFPAVCCCLWAGQTPVCRLSSLSLDCSGRRQGKVGRSTAASSSGMLPRGLPPAVAAGSRRAPSCSSRGALEDSSVLKAEFSQSQ